MSAYLASVTACVVDITFGSQLPQVYSAFGPKILVDSFLRGWCTASKRKSNVVEISPEPILSTNLAWISREKFVELYGNQASSQSEDTDTNQSALKAQAGYFPVDVNELVDLVDVQPEPTPPGPNTVAFQGDKPLSITDQIIKCVLALLPPQYDNRDRLEKMIVNEAKREKGRLWICLLNSEDNKTKAKAQPVVMGYVYVGRKTPRIASIRHVYTRDEYRGKGVATTLVNEANKWYLVGPESGPQHEASQTAKVGDEADVKASVTLFVHPENKAAVRTYSKVGFEIEQVPWEWRGFEGVRPGPF
jgi:ribosomal protein S18 acetylase RimI-like enzyme